MVRRVQLVAEWLASEEEGDHYLEDLDGGRLPDLATSPMISTWGRNPEGAL